MTPETNLVSTYKDQRYYCLKNLQIHRYDHFKKLSILDRPNWSKQKSYFSTVFDRDNEMRTAPDLDAKNVSKSTTLIFIVNENLLQKKNRQGKPYYCRQQQKQ